MKLTRRQFLAARAAPPLKINKIPVFGQFKRSKGVIVHG